MNRRKDIKKYLYQSFLSEFGDELRVYDSRRIPLEETELPCLSYDILKEESELSSETTQETKKKSELNVELVLPDCKELAWLLDDTTARIEQMFAFDRFLGDLVSSIHLKSTETVINTDGGQVLGLARMNYELNYYAAPVENPDYLKITHFSGPTLFWRNNVHIVQ